MNNDNTLSFWRVENMLAALEEAQTALDDLWSALQDEPATLTHLPVSAAAQVGILRACLNAVRRADGRGDHAMNTIPSWRVELMLGRLNEGLANTAVIEAATVGKGIDAACFEALGQLRAELKYVRSALTAAAVTDIAVEAAQ